jgi:hypothetical protein
MRLKVKEAANGGGLLSIPPTALAIEREILASTPAGEAA